MLSNVDRGILYMLIGALFSALNGAVAKILAEDLSALEIVFYRNVIGMGLILYSLQHTPPKLKGGKFHLLFVRGLFGFLAMIMFFYTITTIPLGEAITLNKTSPLFVTILAFYILNDRLNVVTLIAILIGFFGVVLITKPFGYVISHEHFFGILGGFFAAAAYTTIKKIKDVYDTRVIMLSFVFVGSFFPAILFMSAPYIDPPEVLEFLFPEFIVPQTNRVWMLIVSMSLIATLSQWLLTKAYSSSNVSIIGVISYTNIPFAVGFGWLLGDNFPDALTFTGIALIIFGGILVSRNKK